MYNNTFTVLHGMGARKFGIINMGLIGRLPSVQMSRCSGDASGLNRRAAEFNAALGTILANLATKLHRFRYSLADFYGFSNTNFANPSATGKSTKILHPFQVYRLRWDENMHAYLMSWCALDLIYIYKVHEHQQCLLLGPMRYLFLRHRVLGTHGVLVLGWFLHNREGR